MVYYCYMKGKQKQIKIIRLTQILCVCFFVFSSSTSYATFYGGYHYRPYHYGNPYYDGHHYRHNRGHYSHYGTHAYISGDVALLFLGVLGAALLAHTLTNDYVPQKHIYPKAYSYKQPKRKIQAKPVYYRKTVKPINYNYRENEGWEQLANGNTSYALDIFAVQSQQNLDAGEPKLGFAIAAAKLGEKNRAVRAMRKAVRIDANALNNIEVDEIKPEIQKIAKNYQSTANNTSYNSDTAFMMATLSYLQQEFTTASSQIDENDNSQSANNLRELLKRKL